MRIILSNLNGVFGQNAALSKPRGSYVNHFWFLPSFLILLYDIFSLNLSWDTACP